MSSAPALQGPEAPIAVPMISAVIVALNLLAATRARVRTPQAPTRAQQAHPMPHACTQLGSAEMLLTLNVAIPVLNTILSRGGGGHLCSLRVGAGRGQDQRAHCCHGSCLPHTLSG